MKLSLLLAVTSLILNYEGGVSAIESGSGVFSGDGSGGGITDNPCERFQLQPLLPFCFEDDEIFVREGDERVPLVLVSNDFEFGPFMIVDITFLIQDSTATEGEDYRLLNAVQSVDFSGPFTVASLEVVDDGIIDSSFIESLTISIQFQYIDNDGESISQYTNLVVHITDRQGVSEIYCSRDQSCTVAGRMSEDGNSYEMDGDVITCSPSYTADDISLDTTEIDGSFETQFMSSGSFLLLRQLDVFTDAEGFAPCNVSTQPQPCGDPSVVLDRLGLQSLALMYLEEQGKFNSLTLSLDQIQSLVIANDYSIQGFLDDETSRSLHWFLYQLTIQPRLPATICRSPSQSGSTIISFDLPCG